MAGMAITADDINAIMQLTKAPSVEGVTRTSAPSNAQQESNSIAIRANSAVLPTNPINAGAQAANQRAADANAAYQQTSATIMEALAAGNETRNDSYVKIKGAEEEIRAAKGIVAEGQQQIIDRNLGILRQAAKPVADIIAETARENAISQSKAEVILDKQRELREAPGIGGMLTRLWVGNDLTEEYNAVAVEYNSRASIQADAIASTNAIAAFEKSLLPPKTPEQAAAELTLIKSAAVTEAQKANLDQLKDSTDYFNTVLAVGTAARVAASGDAAFKTNVSQAEFTAKVHAMTVAGDMAMRVAALTEAQASVGGKLEADKRVETAFGLTAGEGSRFMDRLTRVDPEAAAAAMQKSYSGQALDSEALTRAYSYMPQDKLTASLRSTISDVQQAGQRFGDYLITKQLDLASFKKLDLGQQLVHRQAFSATPAGAIPSAQKDSTTRAMAAGIAISVPTGIIQIPPVMAPDGVTISRPAKNIQLRSTGELGKQLAVMDGDGTAAVKLAEKAVTEDKRKPEEVAKELTNFFNNVLTTEAAFRWQERKQFGVPPANKFTQTVAVPYGRYGTKQQNLDLADYPTMLTHLVRAKQRDLTLFSFEQTIVDDRAAAAAAAAKGE